MQNSILHKLARDGMRSSATVSILNKWYLNIFKSKNIKWHAVHTWTFRQLSNILHDEGVLRDVRVIQDFFFFFIKKLEKPRSNYMTLYKKDICTNFASTIIRIWVVYVYIHTSNQLSS